MKIYIIIPTFNEAKHIAKVLNGVSKSGLPIVVVDDGSTDGTEDILSKFIIHNSRFMILTHRVNLGKGAAMKTGAEYAFKNGADAVIFMDADGQHSASNIPKFIKALKDYSVVFGSRNLSHGVPLVRFLGNKFASVLIATLFGIYISDLVCGFRALTKHAYNKIKWESPGYAVETETVIKVGKLGLKHCEVQVTTLYYDNVKGVTILDAVNILFDVVKWKFIK